MTRTVGPRTIMLLMLAVSVSIAPGPCDEGTIVEDTPSPWDTDGDGISDSVETNTQNAAHGFMVNFPDSDLSRALGSFDGGSLLWGINLPDTGTGYLHYLNDPKDTDDWGTLALINLIEGAGRGYAASTCADSVTAGPFPSQPGDMSLQYGGYWDDHPGGTHQNGREVDFRYARNDGIGPLDLSLFYLRDSLYDGAATRHLVQCFLNDTTVIKILYDSVYAGFDPPFPNGVMDHDELGNHANHFHVRIADPDGENN